MSIGAARLGAGLGRSLSCTLRSPAEAADAVAPTPFRSCSRTGEAGAARKCVAEAATRAAGVPLHEPGGWSIRGPALIQSKRTLIDPLSDGQLEGGVSSVSTVCGIGS